MGAVDLLEAVVGGLLLFVVPGLALARGLFPEWRFRGPDGPRRALETATLALVLSVALTVLVGSALLGLAPGGFAAAWGDPVLEAALAAIALVAFVAGVVRGAYSKVPPRAPAGAEEPGGEGAFALTRELDRLHREDRALARRLRAARDDGPEASEIDRARTEVAQRIDGLERGREEEYAR
ncbi:MAG TPA: hypothetical protein VML94_01070 [Thermoplasmata archaeon]|nr:hypothetical protein [Thermoplasmata archaeon]